MAAVSAKSSPRENSLSSRPMDSLGEGTYLKTAGRVRRQMDDADVDVLHKWRADTGCGAAGDGDGGRPPQLPLPWPPGQRPPPPRRPAPPPAVGCSTAAGPGWPPGSGCFDSGSGSG